MINDLTKDEAVWRIDAFVVILEHSNLFEMMGEIELFGFIVTTTRLREEQCGKGRKGT
jgi:hypothetical protein